MPPTDVAFVFGPVVLCIENHDVRAADELDHLGFLAAGVFQ
jgi:hypothetical protein